MYKLRNFHHLVRWTAAHTPLWYLLLPLLGIFLAGLALFALGDDTYRSSYPGDSVVAIDPFMLRNVIVHANVVFLGIIAVHFAGRHFRNDRNAVDYLTLPVSIAARMLTIATVIFVVLPILGALSSLAGIMLGRLLFPGIWWPEWKWIVTFLPLSLLPYLLVAIVILAISLLRPRQTVVWISGMILVGAGAVSMLLWLTDGRSQLTIDLGDPALSPPTNVFGPAWPRNEVSFHVFDSLLALPVPVLVACGLFPAVLLLLSSWLALKNRQV